MAGDWMKVRLSLDRDPATQRIACACGVSLSTTVGALVRFWAWANENTATGRIEGLDLGWLDTLVSVPGFGAAMVSVGWLQVVDGQGLTIPKWASHNGENAKRRAQESARKNRVRKMSASCPQNVRMTAGQSADKMRPREEKRREENISTPDGVENPLPPSGGGRLFEVPAKALCIPPELNHPPFVERWEAWIKYRSGFRKKLSPESLSLQLKALSPLGPQGAAECIDESIRNGWQGLFPAKARENGHNPGFTSAKPADRRAASRAGEFAPATTSAWDAIPARTNGRGAGGGDRGEDPLARQERPEI